MNLSLLSTPGRNAFDISYVYEEITSIIADWRRPRVIYIPTSIQEDQFIKFTIDTLSPVAEVVIAGVEDTPLKKLKEEFTEDSLFYVPGGNSYRLINGMHESGYFEFITERVEKGTPYIGFSAGAVICGNTILTSNNINNGYTRLETFGFLPFGLHVHLPSDTESRDCMLQSLYSLSKKEKLLIYSLEDGAHLLKAGNSISCRLPNIWLIDGSKSKIKAQQIGGDNL